MGKKKQRQLQAEATAAAERQTAIAQKMEREARARVDAQRAEYEAFRFENPYATAQNYFAGLENQFEDIGVSTAAADFQMEQGAQQRANIMQQFRGAAGGSGIAGLAQALAQQGTLQARQVSVDISQQQRQGQMMSAQAGMQLQQMAAQGATQRDMMRMQGGQMVQQAEFGRQATLLGMDYGELAGARSAVQQGFGNEMAAWGMGAQMQNARTGMWGDIIGAVGTAAGTALAAKKFLFCIPKGTGVDCENGSTPIEDIKPGDTVIGYNGKPVKVLQKHEYLEDPTVKRFYKIKFKGNNEDTHEVNVCDMHKIKNIRAKDITENVVSKELYDGVNFSYDLLTEDLGYRINNIPVNSMIEELAELTTKLKNK